MTHRNNQEKMEKYKQLDRHKKHTNNQTDKTIEKHTERHKKSHGQADTEQLKHTYRSTEIPRELPGIILVDIVYGYI